MSKHMKKLVSALLAASMLLGSLGVAALADGADTNTSDTKVSATAEPSASPDASATPEATASPDASATPEATASPDASATPAPSATPEATATPEPTATPNPDKYYNEAIGLLSILGIFEGYEDGSFQPEATITRAEMSAVILRTINRKDTLTYRNVFTDVTNHWAADIIQTAYDADIINGMGDGTFAPDAPVTYDQAIKMVVCALNYGLYAGAQGGYPTGYLLVANKKDVQITKNADGEVGEQVTRGTVAKMIYNALNADYPTIVGFEGGAPKYTTQEGKTLASEMHDVYTREGVLTATALKTIDASVTPTAEQLVVDGDLYTNKIKNADDLVASYVKLYYYDENNNHSDMEAIYAFEVAGKNKMVTLQAKDIEEIKDLQDDSAQGIVKYEADNGSTKTYKTVQSPILVLNGQLFNPANEDMNIYDEAGNVTGEYTVEEYLTPDVGTVTLKDFDADGTYDVVMVEKYETIVVTSASEKLVAGKFGKKLEVDTSEDDVIVSVTKDNEAIKTRNLKKMDIATVLETVNNDGDRVITMDVCNDTVTGAISTHDTDKGRTYIEVDGKEYEVDKNAIDDINVGAESTLYLDKFGRVAYIESTAGGKLSGNEKYAWLMNAYESEDGENVEIKLYTQEGTVLSANAAANLKYTGPVGGTYTLNATLKTKDSDDRQTLLKAVKAMDEALTVKDTEYPIKLVKYTTNANGEINKLVMPTSDTSITDGVVVGTTNYKSTMSDANIIGNKYSISTSTVEFTVPRTANDMRTTNTIYATQSVNPENYMGREGVSEDFILAEFDGNKAGVLVKYVIGSSTAADATYNTADNVPIGIITGFTVQYDEEEDETVYGIKISTNGTETQYTTRKETTVSEIDEGTAGDNILKDGLIQREVGGSVLWSMDTQAEGVSSIKDVLEVGDIVGYTTSGSKLNTIVRFVDMSEFADSLNAGDDVKTAMKKVTVGKMGAEMNGIARSKDRDAFVFGQVSEIDIEDNVLATVNYPLSAADNRDLLAIDSSKAIDIYEYESDKTDTDDATGIYLDDIVFVKYHRGSIQQVIVIRK